VALKGRIKDDISFARRSNDHSRYAEISDVTMVLDECRGSSVPTNPVPLPQHNKQSSPLVVDLVR
jgi:hypothetical protein